MVARVLGDDHRAGDRARTVGVLLQCRIPEIFRIVLTTRGKTDRGRCGVAREGEREADFGDAAVRRPALALELQRRRDRYPGSGEVARVGAGIMTFQHQERKTLLGLEENAVEGTEERGKAFGAELFRLRDGQQLDEKSGQLDYMVVGAPGMSVAGADGEAERPIEGRRRVEVADSVHD